MHPAERVYDLCNNKEWDAAYEIVRGLSPDLAQVLEYHIMIRQRRHEEVRESVEKLVKRLLAGAPELPGVLELRRLFDTLPSGSQSELVHVLGALTAMVTIRWRFKELDGLYEILDLSAELIESISSEDKTIFNDWICWFYTIHGLVFWFAGDLAKARASHMKVVRVAGDDVYFSAMGYSNLGIIYLYSSQYELAVENFSKGIAVLEGVESDLGRELRSHNMGNLALAYGGLGRYQEQLDLLIRSQDLTDESTEAYVNGLLNIANTYLKLEDFQQAEDYLDLALEKAKKLNYLRGLGAIYQNMGVLKTYLVEFNDASFYFQLSLEVAEQINDLARFLDVSVHLGYIEMLRGNMEIGFELISKGLNLVNDGDSIYDPAIAGRAWFYKGLAESYMGLSPISSWIKSVEIYRESAGTDGLATSLTYLALEDAEFENELREVSEAHADLVLGYQIAERGDLVPASEFLKKIVDGDYPYYLRFLALLKYCEVMLLLYLEDKPDTLSKAREKVEELQLTVNQHDMLPYWLDLCCLMAKLDLVEHNVENALHLLNEGELLMHQYGIVNEDIRKLHEEMVKGKTQWVQEMPPDELVARVIQSLGTRGGSRGAPPQFI